jgi:hypothetical protein
LWHGRREKFNREKFSRTDSAKYHQSPVRYRLAQPAIGPRHCADKHGSNQWFWINQSIARFAA